MKEENPANELEHSVVSSELIKINEGIGEAALDYFLDEGVIRDIPFVGSIVSAAKIGNAINNYFFAKKVYKFLNELKEIPFDKRQKKLDEITASKKHQSKVGDVILELLDKIDVDYKPEIIGKLFRAYVLDKISYDDYLRLSFIVKTCYYHDLPLLINYDKNDWLYHGNTDNLISLGLTSNNIDAWDKDEDPSEKVSGTILKLGKQLVEFGLK